MELQSDLCRQPDNCLIKEKYEKLAVEYFV
jgi:hypothetical protein